MKRVIAPANWKDGKLEIVDRERMISDLHSVFGTFPNIVEVIIQRVGRTRSARQNRFLWGVAYPIVVGFTGDDIDSVHKFFKGKFLKKSVKLFDEEIEGQESTADLTTVEFEEYVEKIRMFMAPHGVDIPLPNEYIRTNEGDEE
jgi:hypothetical protein